MVCRSILAASLVLSLSLLPAAAQQAFDPSTVAPSPLVESLARSTGGDGNVVELQGFVGPSTPETVRLYTDMTLRHYLEIPRQSIVQQVPGATESEPVTLYTSSSTVIGAVTRAPAGTYGQARALAKAFGAMSAPKSPGDAARWSTGETDCEIYLLSCMVFSMPQCLIGVGYCAVRPPQ